MGFTLNHLIGFAAGGPGELVWVDTFVPVAPNVNAGSWSGLTTRQVIAAASFTRSGDHVRVTFVAPTDSTFVVLSAYIGLRRLVGGDSFDFETTPTELKFNNGASGFSLAAGGSIVSDATPFVLDETQTYLVSMYISTGNARYLNDASYTIWYKSANEPALVDATGYTSSGRLQAISRIEVANSPPLINTWNPSDKSSSITLSNGDLTMAVPLVGGNHLVRAKKGMSSGKWYWEMKATAMNTNCCVGIAKAGASLSGYVGQDSQGWGKFATDGDIYNNQSVVFNGGSFVVNDIIGFAFDADSGKLFIHKNGTYENSGDPVAGTGQVVSGLTSGPYYPAASDASSGSDSCTIVANFGATAFVHTPPSGYDAPLLA